MVFTNISEEYGPGEHVTITDYLDLKPDGSFKEDFQFEVWCVLEEINGEWKVIARGIEEDNSNLVAP